MFKTGKKSKDSFVKRIVEVCKTTENNKMSNEYAKIYENKVCPCCGCHMDDFKLLRNHYNPVEMVCYCRTCMMDWYRKEIIGNERTVESINEFYLFCERSHYLIYLFRDWKYILNNTPSLFTEIWIDLESNLIWSYKDFWIEIFMYINEHKINVMSESDIKVFDSLPNKFTIYRGASHEDGISWTLSKGKAEWFKERFGDPDAIVWKREVTKNDIVCYFNDRGEREMIYLGCAS